MDTILKNQYVLYIPSTMDINNTISIQENEKFIDYIINRCLAFVSGVTVSKSIGYWRSEKGLVRENITKIAIFSNDYLDTEFSIIAQYICKELKQECVSLEINNVLHLIYPV